MKYLFSAAFCVFHFISSAQQGKMDSLLSCLKSDKEDTIKVIHLYELTAEYYLIGDFEKGLDYGTEALKLSRKLNFKRGAAQTHNNIGNIYLGQGDYPQAYENYKAALGGLTEDEQSFESHEMNLKEGDTFYIFTDGLADQFNGENSKKLTTTKFKEILLGIQDKTMEEQESYLEDFMEKWKAGSGQIDDILVVGVRL